MNLRKFFYDVLEVRNLTRRKVNNSNFVDQRSYKEFEGGLHQGPSSFLPSFF